MNFVRKIVKWIKAHRLVSLLIFMFLIVGLIGFRFVKNRTDGILTDPITRGPIINSVYGIGTVLANKSYQLKVGVVSTIEELYVKEGDTVKKGAAFAKIDGIVYRAPFKGTVTYLPYKVRENIFSNIPILTIVDLTDRYLIISLEQQGALRVRHGQSVKMSFDTIREQNYDGVVQSVYSNEGNFLARIDLSTLPERILPGMTADVAISIETREKVMLVPVASLERGGIVWRKRGRGIPSKVPIKIGIVDKAMAEVVSGELSEGDRLLIRKNSSL